MLNRREVLNLGVSAAAASALMSNNARAVQGTAPLLHIIDSNVSLFHWPFRRLPLDEPAALVTRLGELGISRAWAGTFEAILHRNISDVNERLANTCRSHPELVPIGSINPTLPNWQEDVRRCFSVHLMPGIRLYPNYHGYSLADPRFTELLRIAASEKRFVQLAVAMEDTRTQHKSLHATDVDLAPLADVMSQAKGVRIQLLNYRPNSSQIEELVKIPGLFFDTSRVEGSDGVPWLVERLPAGRVLFGSHAPFLIPEAALIRVHESDQLDETALRSVYAGNAKQFRQGAGS